MGRLQGPPLPGGRTAGELVGDLSSGCAVSIGRSCEPAGAAIDGPRDRSNATGTAVDASATRNYVTGAVIDRPAPVDLITNSASPCEKLHAAEALHYFGDCTNTRNFLAY